MFWWLIECGEKEEIKISGCISEIENIRKKVGLEKRWWV